MPEVMTIEGRRYEVDHNGCWRWLGGINADGYGYLVIAGSTLYAHRVSYQLHIGPINHGQQIDHLCRVRSCINPDHLDVVSSRENSMRGNHPRFVLAREQRCAEGHDLTIDANVYVRPDGRRCCRVCQVKKRRQRVSPGVLQS